MRLSFRFNDELLLTPADQALAEQRFPNIYFALEHQELKADFRRIDRAANRSKSRSRTIGISALVFAVVSLLAFPLEPLIVSASREAEGQSIFRIIAIIGAICGVLAVLLGNVGIWFGRLKRDWLQRRLMTERLRQWHAQYLIAHAKEICEAAGSEADEAAFLHTRALDYQRFKRAVIEQVASEYTKYTVTGSAAYSGLSGADRGSVAEFWIDPGWAKLATRKIGEDHAEALQELFTAYQETRLLGQVQYTNYVLSSEGKFWSLPAKQVYILGSTAFALVMFAFVANFIALLSASWPGFPVGHSVLGSIAISFAILAVGVRALQEGLRPQRELRRMGFYASAVNAARDRFVAARTPGKKIEAMLMLERASFEEMVEFLSTNERARFVL